MTREGYIVGKREMRNTNKILAEKTEGGIINQMQINLKEIEGECVD
jgi:hypothetical protein